MTIGAPPTVEQQEYDRRSVEQLDAFMRAITPEQLTEIFEAKAFTPELKDLLIAVFKTRIERNAVYGATPSPTEPVPPEPVVTPPPNGHGAASSA